jgi:two-component system LytT family response regulator
MSSFRVLVVDDEPLAREVIVDLLRRDAEIVGVTETGDPDRVSRMISLERPDILFLDIQMPGLSGLQIASASRTSPRPVIVFVTAFAEHALEAFDVEATDYLLKPFADERFFQALDRAKKRVHESRSTAAAVAGVAASTNGPTAQILSPGVQEPKAYLKSLAVGHGPEIGSVDLLDVLWIEAEDYYVLVHTRRDRHLLRMSMASLEERLDPRTFVRTHRAAIVNVREIAQVDPGCVSLVLSDGTRVAISRSRREGVERLVRACLNHAI